MTIDGRDVAGVEETLLVQDLAAFPLEIRLGNRRPAHLETAHGIAVPRQAGAGIVGDLHCNDEGAVSLLLLNVEAGRTGKIAILRLKGASGSKRAHLGHTPRMDDLDPIGILESLRHRPR